MQDSCSFKFLSCNKKLSSLCPSKIPSLNSIELPKDQVVLLLLDHLGNMGYLNAKKALEEESNITLETYKAEEFTKCLMNGDWDGAERYLDEFEIDEKNLIKIKFFIRKQNYLELLLTEGEDIEKPIDVLQNQLTPLDRNLSKVSELATLLIFANFQDNLRDHLQLNQSVGFMRSQLVRDVCSLFPPRVFSILGRLEVLLKQAIYYQYTNCENNSFHQSLVPKPVDLFLDHSCSFQSHTWQTIFLFDEHMDQVNAAQFSNSGSFIATADNAGEIIIFLIDKYEDDNREDENEGNLSQMRDYTNHLQGDNDISIIEKNAAIVNPIGHEFTSPLRLLNVKVPVISLCWSKDDEMLLVTHRNQIDVWHLTTKKVLLSIEPHTLEISNALWMHSTDDIVTCGFDGFVHFIPFKPLLKLYESVLVDNPSSLVNNRLFIPHNHEIISRSWRVGAVNDMAISKDEKWLITIDQEQKICWIDLTHTSKMPIDVSTKYSHVAHIIQTEVHLVSCNISNSDRYLTVCTFSGSSPFLGSHPSQKIFVYDVATKYLVHVYSGLKQARFVIRASIGGPNDEFLASGSEDSLLHIWGKNGYLYRLAGHTSIINCATWNAKNPRMLATVSDDHSVRIWRM